MRRIGAMRDLMRRMGVGPSDFQDEVEERAVGTTPARLSHE